MPPGYVYILYQQSRLHLQWIIIACSYFKVFKFSSWDLPFKMGWVSKTSKRDIAYNCILTAYEVFAQEK